MTTTTIPARLTLTLEQVRERLVAQIGVRGVGTAWWSLTDPDTNDCLGFLLWAMGVRDRNDFANPLVSISGFRAVSGWHEVDPDEIRPGDIVLWAWNDDDDDIADHAEFCYSTDRPGTLTDVSANTGPKVGDDIEKHPELRGVAKKTRPFAPTPHARIVAGIRPPYAPAATGVKPSDRANVRIVGTYLNATVQAVYEGRAFHRTGAGTIGTVKGDGIRGPLYWLLVQLWGRLHNLYGRAFKIDGIPGPQSRRVEAEILRLARVSRYAKAA